MRLCMRSHISEWRSQSGELLCEVETLKLGTCSSEEAELGSPKC